MLLTQDVDFADIRMYPPRQYPGIVVFRLASQTRDDLLEIGALLIETLVSSSPNRQLWIVEGSRVRIRE